MRFCSVFEPVTLHKYLNSPVLLHIYTDFLPLKGKKSGRQDLNLRPLRPERKSTSKQTSENTRLTTNEPSACTGACTREAENRQKSVSEGIVEPKPVEQTCSDKNPADSDLQELDEIVQVWPELPEHIKAAIKALIQTHNKGEK